MPLHMVYYRTLEFPGGKGGGTPGFWGGGVMDIRSLPNFIDFLKNDF